MHSVLIHKSAKCEEINWRKTEPKLPTRVYFSTNSNSSLKTSASKAKLTIMLIPIPRLPLTVRERGKHGHARQKERINRNQALASWIVTLPISSYHSHMQQQISLPCSYLLPYTLSLSCIYQATNSHPYYFIYFSTRSLFSILFYWCSSSYSSSIYSPEAKGEREGRGEGRKENIAAWATKMRCPEPIRVSWVDLAFPNSFSENSHVLSDVIILVVVLVAWTVAKHGWNVVLCCMLSKLFISLFNYLYLSTPESIYLSIYLLI